MHNQSLGSAFFVRGSMLACIQVMHCSHYDDIGINNIGATCTIKNGGSRNGNFVGGKVAFCLLVA